MNVRFFPWFKKGGVDTAASDTNPLPVTLYGLTSEIGVNTETATSGALWSGNTWTGAGEQNGLVHVGVNVQTDEDGTLFFHFSLNGSDWSSFPDVGSPVVAGINEIHTAVKLGRYFRPVFVGNDGSRTYFRAYTFYSPVPIELNSPLSKAMSQDTDAKPVKPAHQVQYAPAISEVSDGQFDTPSLTRLREIRTRDQRAVDVENCNDASQLTIFGDDTANLADTNDHVFGAGAITFDKANGTGNTVFAGVSRVLASTLNIGEIFEDGGFVAAGVKLPSINNVDYVFVRLGTDASNYNEWRWAAEALTSGEWLQLRRATAQPSAYLGTGWQDDAVDWCAFGVAFGAQSNTLAGIKFDNVHLVQGRISDTTIVASIDSNVSGNKVNVTKLDGASIDKNIGSATAGTQRVVLASDQSQVPVGDSDVLAALVNRYGGGKEPATATLTNTSQTAIHTPAGGNAVRVYWVSVINRTPATSIPAVTIRIGSKIIYLSSAVSHWEIFTGAANEVVTGQLSSNGTVDVTIHYEEFTP